MSGRLVWMSKSGREALLDVRKARLDVRKWLRGPPGCSGVVGMPYRMSGSGRLAIPDVREWSGGHPGRPRVVGRPSWMSRRLV